MVEPLLFALLAVLLVGFIVVIWIVQRSQRAAGETARGLEALERAQEREERSFRDEFARNREESRTAAAAHVDSTSASLSQLREALAVAAKNQREELKTSIDAFAEISQSTVRAMGEALFKLVSENTIEHRAKLKEFSEGLSAIKDSTEHRLRTSQSEHLGKLDQLREETMGSSKAHREELSASLTKLSETMVKQITEIGTMLKTPIENVVGQTSKLSESNAERLEALRVVVDSRLKQLQDDNTLQIDKMRATVDEKLQGTLEKRLGESFKQVSERLEQVHQGLGAMQQLASDVGGLQKVLTNVKTRGGWGEVQLGSLLEQVLTPDQFARNVKTRDDSGDHVEFAIKLPGGENGKPVWLPIDAKFPTEDYQRLQAAQEQGDAVAIESSMKGLEAQLRKGAKDICGKYINPPNTTDFGIMFLPTEGLYAEAIRRVGLVEQVQRDCRVVFAGPTTLAALLNSLQMGFRTLTIQKRSSEVWNLLAGVKRDFGTFGDLLDGVKKKLDQASGQIEDASRKSRRIEKKLKNVGELPEANPTAIVEQLLPELANAPEDE